MGKRCLAGRIRELHCVKNLSIVPFSHGSLQAGLGTTISCVLGLVGVAGSSTGMASALTVYSNVAP